MAGGGAACSSYWTVFTDPQGVTYDPCNDRAIYEDPKAFNANEVVYPVSEGPFDGGGLTGCVFSQPLSIDVASMACGGSAGTCVKEKIRGRLFRSAPSHQGPAKQTWFGVVSRAFHSCELFFFYQRIRAFRCIKISHPVETDTSFHFHSSC